MKRKGWFRLPVRDRELSERDVNAELSAHLEARVEQLMAAGMSEAEAHVEAERRLGGVAHARDRLIREAWDRDTRLSFAEGLSGVRDDVRHAVRALGRQRGFAFVVVVTLALGIGANATMFGLLDRLLLSGPAHVVEPDELQRFYATVQHSHQPEPSTFSFLNGVLLKAFREDVTALEDISGYMSHTLTLGSGPGARRLELAGVSASFFRLTGATPALGRFFDEREETPPGERVIVVGHALWQSELGARPDVIGETLVLSGEPYIIIGVAPRGFTGVELAPRDGWVPLSVTAAAAMGPDWQTQWMGFYMPIVGRLRAGESTDRAAAQATAAWRAAAGDGPGSTGDPRVSFAGIGADRDGEQPMEARVAKWLMAVAAIVLLVACANVANLYFARGLLRRREIAVRLALGISRGRLMRLLLVESMLLALVGGLAALVVAHWGAEIVRNVLVPNVDWTTSSPLNPRVLAVAVVATTLVGLITGLAPAFMASSPRLAPALAGSVHVPPAPGRARSALAVLQAAFCVVLLVGAGVFIRSLYGVLQMDLGMESDRVVAMSMEWETPSDLTEEQRTQLSADRRTFLRDAVDRVAAEPGVEFASIAIGAAFSGAFGASVRVEGLDSIPGMPGGGPYISAVGADYFSVLGTPVLRGRSFGQGEGAGTDPVVVVSRITAAALWPGGDPIGQCVYMGTAPDTPCSRVVGVVADTRRFGITEDAAMQFYVPFGQQPAWMGGIRILARTALRPSAMVEPLRRIMHTAAPAIRYVNIMPFTELLEPQRRPWKLGAVLFALCGGLALTIAAIGLYSVIAYLVLHRRHEIGVRMALGAERRSIIGMIMRQAVVLAGAGIVIGGVAALLAAPHIEPLLFNTPARDPAVLGTTAATLVLAAIAAGVVPAWRASRVQPTEAFRNI